MRKRYSGPKRELVYYLFFKPAQVVCRFTPEIPGQKCLRDFLPVENDVYPVGRLDMDSEGLLILTNDPAVNQMILSPEKSVVKTYTCLVEGDFTDAAFDKMQCGVEVRIQKQHYFMKPEALNILHAPPDFPPRFPPIRERKTIPVSWVEIGITEGKNHQVRKMFASIGFPVLRLIRTGIGKLNLIGLDIGTCKRISMAELLKGIQK
ncbi:MAG: pseudouridine synthase [Saprospiraceae bacterium]|nr:pseudouridine synthase [Saprospiraceae bacterium]